MQHTLDRKTAARIAERNDPARIRFRITLRHSLLYLAMFAAGLWLGRALHLVDLPGADLLFRSALTSPLAECDTARDGIRAILMSARYEGLLLSLLLCAGMTMFSEFACGTVLTLHGGMCGIFCYGTAYLTAARQIAGESLPFFVNFFAMWATAALLLIVSVEAVIFSYRYRDIGRGPRRQRESLSIHYILLALTYIGTLTVIVTARAMILLLI